MKNSETTRRSFLRGSGALVGASLLHSRARAQDGADSAELRVALVGCGGRGTGAAAQALRTSGAVRLVAMADAFRDRLDGSLETLLGTEDVKDRVEVPEERRFTGFDAYQRAIDQDVDVVILTTPPGFRPRHFEYAVSKGRHVFMEKPVAVDGPGVRQVLAAAEEAKRRNLKVGVGLQRHHDPRYEATIQAIHDGAVGDVVLMRCYWNGSGVWVRPRQEGMTEMEYQMRNWYYFNWLCGDHIVEQHIHNIDVCNWIMEGPPVRAQGQGGRQVRDGLDHGEIFDHHMIEFTYASGAKLLSQCRHIAGCWNSVSEHVHGTTGSGDVGAGKLALAGGERWRYDGEGGDAYQIEHDRLFRAIREDLPHNEAELGASSSLTAILGRMASYSGKEISYADALASELVLAPDRLSWTADPKSLPDDAGRYLIPTPGATRAL